VRFIDAALSDLQQLIRKGDPQVVRWALRKCLLLERNPEAGEPLRGPLAGYRKLAIGDRDWRIVWRVTHDDTGRRFVDVAEVWAVGARSDSQVYAEMQSRVATLAKSPATLPLAEVIELLGRIGTGQTTSSDEPPEAADETIPEWLVLVLTTVVKMPHSEVVGLTAAQAQNLWNAYKSSQR
jgi:mRNA interferase RelE/StbE